MQRYEHPDTKHSEHKDEIYDFLSKRGLLELSEHLHMFTNGSGDAYSYYMPHVIEQYLGFRLDNWNFTDSRYDDAVYNLIDAVLDERELARDP
jgi:hypothetical protein